MSLSLSLSKGLAILSKVMTIGILGSPYVRKLPYDPIIVVSIFFSITLYNPNIYL